MPSVVQARPGFAGMQICDDGWRRKSAAQGTPLQNVLVLKPEGGAIFLEVIPPNGEYIQVSLFVHPRTHVRVLAFVPAGHDRCTVLCNVADVCCVLVFHFADELKVDKTAKTGQAIAKQQKEMALKPARGDATKVLGTMQDNTPANRKAMRLLDDECPT